MDLRIKAAAFFLVHLPGDTGTHQEQLDAIELKNYPEFQDDFAVNLIDENGLDIRIWEPFENETVGGILERIDELEHIYTEIWNEGCKAGLNGLKV